MQQRLGNVIVANAPTTRNNYCGFFSEVLDWVSDIIASRSYSLYTNQLQSQFYDCNWLVYNEYDRLAITIVDIMHTVVSRVSATLKHNKVHRGAYLVYKLHTFARKQLH